EGLKALDSHTLQVKLTQPYPQLIHIMTMGFAAPVAREVTAKYGQEGLAERMVGTGPFQLKKVTRGSKIELVRNPTYRGEAYPSQGDAAARAAGLLADAGKMIPFIDGIVFHVFKEDQPQWLQFQKGNIDASGIPKDNFSSAIQTGVDADCANALKNAKLGPELEKKGILLSTSPEPVIWYLNFNVKDKLLGQNANLRKAMVRALNRDEMIRLFLNCRGVKATSIVPPVIAGHVAREKLEGDFNLEEAKKYLAQAGFPGGKGLAPIKFDLRGSSTSSRQQAEYVAKSMAAIGVPIEVVVNTFPAYLEKEKNGNLQFFFGGWSADYPDAENFMQLLYGKNASPGPNASNWINREYDALYEKIAKMAPSPARSAMIKRAEDIAFRDAVWSMLYYPIRFSLRHGWLRNYRPNSMISNDLKYIDVDQELKQRYLKEKF
ncbi:MAG: hypothetical protein HUU37_10805, partial [Bdellovibrionales bacterium]|nr:hypothetical protein [Bdellovibrionales bacterium]